MRFSKFFYREKNTCDVAVEKLHTEKSINPLALFVIQKYSHGNGQWSLFFSLSVLDICTILNTFLLYVCARTHVCWHYITPATFWFPPNGRQNGNNSTTLSKFATQCVRVFPKAFPRKHQMVYVLFTFSATSVYQTNATDSIWKYI